MPPPVAVYVVAALAGVAAIYAFKEFVYEPHIAPHLEAWAEDFLERRRAARSRRASAVPVRTSRRPHDASSSSDSSHHDDDPQGEDDENERTAFPHFSADEFELEALTSREVDEWRNEVLRSHERTRDGLRKRRTGTFRDTFDGFDSASMTLDESFTSLTHTPLVSTHVISNLSSPITPSTISLPLTPTGRLRSESQSTTTQRDANATIMVPHSTSPIHDIPVISPTPRPPINGVGHLDIASPSPIAIPNAAHRSPVTEDVSLTPTYDSIADDSPFGPLLPDTPRSSAEIYGERPFSPITRAMGSSSSSVSTTGSRGTLSSRANSIRTLGGSGVVRRGSGLANEVVARGSDDSSDEDPEYGSTSSFRQANSVPGMNGSVVSSLSERYPAAPTPPVIVSPPASSIGVLSPPSSPGSEVVVHHDALATSSHSPSDALPPAQLHTSLPLLQLPPESPGTRSVPANSPALSYVSFLSPMPLSRTASGSEADEFLSVASDDSGWSVSPVTPSGHTGPVQDRLNNPFLDFEHVRRTPSAGSAGSEPEHAGGSEGSEVVVSDNGQEVGSEVGSDESWERYV